MKLEESPLLHVGNLFWKKGPGIANNSRGASGGVATFWDTSLYDLEAEERSMHWVFTKLTHKISGRTVVFSIFMFLYCMQKKKIAGIASNRIST